MMSGLTLSWEYLTGYVVATDPASREKAEWPPHPARVFMAMAAAWFETPPVHSATEQELSDYEAEAQALRWLETLESPELLLPKSHSESVRTAVTVYVPVNDKIDPDSPSLQCAQAFTRSRQAREFPKRFIGDLPCRIHWDVADASRHVEALDRLCRKVTRIGHSSSLVHMWATTDPVPDESTHDLWRPTQWDLHSHVRIVTDGLFDALPKLTRIDDIERFAEFTWRVEDADRDAQTAKAAGDAKSKKETNAAFKQAKQDFEQQIGLKWKKGLPTPARLRPNIGIWSGYGIVGPTDSPARGLCSHFDTDLVMLTRVDGPQLPLGATLQAVRALRGTILAQCGQTPIPEWVSGHVAGGTPSSDHSGHLALMPLPFVGHPHADGRLLGLALAFPRSVDRKARGQTLGSILFDMERFEPKPIRLRLGNLGVWTIRKPEWGDNRLGVRPESWTAMPEGARCWASVTPVVLDRYPKADRTDPTQRQAWVDEVTEVIAGSCAKIGLPQPTKIDFGTTGWHSGTPRAYSKQRRLRSQYASGKETASLGDGFALYPSKQGASRPQVHARIEFSEPVLGPILLGAGRFMGYGVFKPWRPSR